MNPWERFATVARGGQADRILVVLIVDSPWLPGYAGITTLDFFCAKMNGCAPNSMCCALKRDFGKDVAFWGGGYVFNTTHNIQADVPPQNIVAMIEALREA